MSYAQTDIPFYKYILDEVMVIQVTEMAVLGYCAWKSLSNSLAVPAQVFRIHMRIQIRRAHQCGENRHRGASKIVSNVRA